LVEFLDCPGQTTLVKWKDLQDAKALDIWCFATQYAFLQFCLAVRTGWRPSGMLLMRSCVQYLVTWPRHETSCWSTKNGVYNVPSACLWSDCTWWRPQHYRATPTWMNCEWRYNPLAWSCLVSKLTNSTSWQYSNITICSTLWMSLYYLLPAPRLCCMRRWATGFQCIALFSTQSAQLSRIFVGGCPF
jgi:hypothetical protein